MQTVRNSGKDIRSCIAWDGGERPRVELREIECTWLVLYSTFKGSLQTLAKFKDFSIRTHGLDSAVHGRSGIVPIVRAVQGL